MEARPAVAHNRRTAWLLGGVVAGMFAFGFALVPLYGLLCDALGIPTSLGAGVRRPAAAADAAPPGRAVKVRFDATVNRNLPWQIEAPVRRVEVITGTLAEARFRVHNAAAQPITAQAIPGIVPWQATEYVQKVECFCFERQTLAPGETRDLVLRFIVAPDLPQAITNLTVSYTFMNTAGAVAAGPSTSGGG